MALHSVMCTFPSALSNAGSMPTGYLDRNSGSDMAFLTPKSFWWSNWTFAAAATACRRVKRECPVCKVRLVRVRVGRMGQEGELAWVHVELAYDFGPGGRHRSEGMVNGVAEKEWKLATPPNSRSIRVDLRVRRNSAAECLSAVEYSR